MNYPTTYDGSARSSLPTQQMFPPTPFPRKYVHSVFKDLQQAEQAIQALHDAGYDARDIHLLASQEFVAAIEHRLQQKNALSETLMRFFASTDDGFPGDMYLHEARRGHHILVVYLPRAEQMEQVRDLLAPYHAHFIKYIGTWTVTDLPSFSGSHRAESQSVPHGMRHGGRGELVGIPSDAVGLAGRHPVAARPVGTW
jgi:hypothetical protein